MTNIIYYCGKKHDSYPEGAVRLTKASLRKNVTKTKFLVFPAIKVPKTRLRQHIINKLASAIKIMFDYDDGNLNDPITLTNIKNGVFDERITLKLPAEMPEKISKLGLVLDDSYIHFTLE